MSARAGVRDQGPGIRSDSGLSFRRWLCVLALLAALPLLTASGVGAVSAISRYAPDLEALLLANGYAANVVDRHGLQGLRASQRSYSASVWARDLDYAISGYSYALDDMSVFRASAGADHGATCL